jgi:hypothetical protein
MTTIRGGTLTALALALFADVAPSPSSCGSGCRSDPPFQFTYFEVSASNCSCAPGAIRVSVDDRIAGTVTCGPSGAISIRVTPGSHVVGAQSETASWSPQTQDAAPGKRTPVDLGCPSK